MPKENATVLFQIICEDIGILLNDKPQTLPGGAVYDVCDFTEGEVYVTTAWHRPGEPQYVPWSFARKMTAEESESLATATRIIERLGFERALAISESAGVFHDKEPASSAQKLAYEIALNREPDATRAMASIRKALNELDSH